MAYNLNVGDPIPSFKAHDQSGKEWSSEDLKGNPCVIYFYPKDDTPGCTKEACGFRDNIDDFASKKVALIGVSPDSSTSHQRFVTKYGLNFNLLADEERELCKKFDVIQEKVSFGKKTVGVVRTTFLVDANGIIQWIERPVTVEGHIERVKEAMKKL